MQNWKEKLCSIAYLLPVVALLTCIGLGLSGYVKPEYEVKAVEQENEKQDDTQEDTADEVPKTIAEESQSTQEADSTEKVTVNINKTVELPVTNTNASTSTISGEQKTVEQTEDAEAYKDGSYYGTGTGFGGTIKVKVTIKNGKISQIQVVDTQDGEAYMEKASALLNEIIRKQSTNVDTVSGATYSSVGLIEAVRDALKDAETKEVEQTEQSQTRNQQKETEAEKETKKLTNETFPYKDGVYFGTGEGYRGDITVAVCICNQKIAYLLVTDASDDDAFLSKAKKLLKTIQKQQSTDVDVVSGATYSSNGIIEAVQDALATAKKTANQGEKPSEANTEKETTEKQTAADTTAGEQTTETGTEEGENRVRVYENGVYTAEAICVPDGDGDFDAYTIALKIAVENDKIISITDVAGTGDLYDLGNDWYIARAVDGTRKYPGIVSQILSKGVVEDIDVVSGATCSSKAVIEAANKALESAKIIK